MTMKPDQIPTISTSPRGNCKALGWKQHARGPGIPPLDGLHGAAKSASATERFWMLELAGERGERC